MKATVTIDDEVFSQAKALAEERSISIDAMISELTRRGLQSIQPSSERNGLPVFAVRAGAKTITSEDVRGAEDEP